MIQVLIASDIRLYRDGLADILCRQTDVEVTGRAASPDETLQLALRLRPDVVLLDMVLPESLTTVRALVLALPQTKVVALGIPEHEREVIECAEAGVSGYVTRDDGIDKFVATVRGVARGEVLCSARVAATLLRRVTELAAEHHRISTAFRLTTRELEIVDLIGDGLSNKQIAQRLQIELPTVKNHVHNILEKTGTHRRTEVVARARNEGLLLARRPLWD